MLEIPESAVLARQLNETVKGKTIRNVSAGKTEHKFTFFYGDPSSYGKLLNGKIVGLSSGMGAMAEIEVGTSRLVLNDGVCLRFYGSAMDVPVKNQLLVEFEDGSALAATVQMYGGIYAFNDGDFENKYYLAAKEKISPFDDRFDLKYFSTLFEGGWEKLSAKAFLATGQRIPGLGNGTLQDILFCSGINPRRRMGTLGDEEIKLLFEVLKYRLSEMERLGGRDTERDLFGNPGNYKTLMSKNAVGKPCTRCGASIQKSAYLGGSVYWCPVCQALQDI
jgi:Formamidopyrimidine-DNA glycosylase